MGDARAYDDLLAKCRFDASGVNVADEHYILAENICSALKNKSSELWPLSSRARALGMHVGPFSALLEAATKALKETGPGVEHKRIPSPRDRTPPEGDHAVLESVAALELKSALTFTQDKANKKPLVKALRRAESLKMETEEVHHARDEVAMYERMETCATMLDSASFDCDEDALARALEDAHHLHMDANHHHERVVLAGQILLCIRAMKDALAGTATDELEAALKRGLELSMDRTGGIVLLNRVEAVLSVRNVLSSGDFASISTWDTLDEALTKAVEHGVTVDTPGIRAAQSRRAQRGGIEALLARINESKVHVDAGALRQCCAEGADMNVATTPWAPQFAEANVLGALFGDLSNAIEDCTVPPDTLAALINDADRRHVRELGPEGAELMKRADAALVLRDALAQFPSNDDDWNALKKAVERAARNGCRNQDVQRGQEQLEERKSLDDMLSRLASATAACDAPAMEDWIRTCSSRGLAQHAVVDEARAVLSCLGSMAAMSQDASCPCVDLQQAVAQAAALAIADKGARGSAAVACAQVALRARKLASRSPSAEADWDALTSVVDDAKRVGLANDDITRAQGLLLSRGDLDRCGRRLRDAMRTCDVRTIEDEVAVATSFDVCDPALLVTIQKAGARLQCLHALRDAVFSSTRTDILEASIASADADGIRLCVPGGALLRQAEAALRLRCALAEPGVADGATQELTAAVKHAEACDLSGVEMDAARQVLKDAAEILKCSARLRDAMRECAPELRRVLGEARGLGIRGALAEQATERVRCLDELKTAVESSSISANHLANIIGAADANGIRTCSRAGAGIMARADIALRLRSLIHSPIASEDEYERLSLAVDNAERADLCGPDLDVGKRLVESFQHMGRAAARLHDAMERFDVEVLNVGLQTAATLGMMQSPFAEVVKNAATMKGTFDKLRYAKKAGTSVAMLRESIDDAKAIGMSESPAREEVVHGEAILALRVAKVDIIELSHAVRVAELVGLRDDTPELVSARKALRTQREMLAAAQRLEETLASAALEPLRGAVAEGHRVGLEDSSHAATLAKARALLGVLEAMAERSMDIRAAIAGALSAGYSDGDRVICLARAAHKVRGALQNQPYDTVEQWDALSEAVLSARTVKLSSSEVDEAAQLLDTRSSYEDAASELDAAVRAFDLTRIARGIAEAESIQLDTTAWRASLERGKAALMTRERLERALRAPGASAAEKRTRADELNAAVQEALSFGIAEDDALLQQASVVLQLTTALSMDLVHDHSAWDAVHAALSAAERIGLRNEDVDAASTLRTRRVAIEAAARGIIDHAANGDPRGLQLSLAKARMLHVPESPWVDVYEEGLAAQQFLKELEEAMDDNPQWKNGTGAVGVRFLKDLLTRADLFGMRNGRDLGPKLIGDLESMLAAAVEAQELDSELGAALSLPLNELSTWDATEEVLAGALAVGMSSPNVTAAKHMRERRRECRLLDQKLEQALSNPTVANMRECVELGAVLQMDNTPWSSRYWQAKDIIDAFDLLEASFAANGPVEQLQEALQSAQHCGVQELGQEGAACVEKGRVVLGLRSALRGDFRTLEAWSALHRAHEAAIEADLNPIEAIQAREKLLTREPLEALAVRMQFAQSELVEEDLVAVLREGKALKMLESVWFRDYEACAELHAELVALREVVQGGQPEDMERALDRASRNHCLGSSARAKEVIKEARMAMDVLRERRDMVDQIAALLACELTSGEAWSVLEETIKEAEAIGATSPGITQGRRMVDIRLAESMLREGIATGDRWKLTMGLHAADRLGLPREGLVLKAANILECMVGMEQGLHLGDVERLTEAVHQAEHLNYDFHHVDGNNDLEGTAKDVLALETLYKQSACEEDDDDPDLSTPSPVAARSPSLMASYSSNSLFSAPPGRSEHGSPESVTTTATAGGHDTSAPSPARVREIYSACRVGKADLRSDVRLNELFRNTSVLRELPIMTATMEALMQFPFHAELHFPELYIGIDPGSLPPSVPVIITGVSKSEGSLGVLLRGSNGDVPAEHVYVASIASRDINGALLADHRAWQHVCCLVSVEKLSTLLAEIDVAAVASTPRGRRSPYVAALNARRLGPGALVGERGSSSSPGRSVRERTREHRLELMAADFVQKNHRGFRGRPWPEFFEQVDMQVEERVARFLTVHIACCELKDEISYLHEYLSALPFPFEARLYDADTGVLARVTGILAPLDRRVGVVFEVDVEVQVAAYGGVPGFMPMRRHVMVEAKNCFPVYIVQNGRDRIVRAADSVGRYSNKQSRALADYRFCFSRFHLVTEARVSAHVEQWALLCT